MMFFLIIWSLSSLGFFALACAMSKHQKQIFGHELDTAKARFAVTIGWVLLISALLICTLSGSISNMISYWLGALTFAALFIGLCLSYLEQRLKTAAAMTACIGAAAALFYLI